MKTIATTGAVLAAAALSLAVTSTTLTTPASAAGNVKCAGINACKGQSECQTAKSSCNGMNSCKGKGWLSTTSAEECTSKGGKVITG